MKTSLLILAAACIAISTIHAQNSTAAFNASLGTITPADNIRSVTTDVVGTTMNLTISLVKPGLPPKTTLGMFVSNQQVYTDVWQGMQKIEVVFPNATTPSTQWKTAIDLNRIRFDRYWWFDLRLKTWAEGYTQPNTPLIAEGELHIVTPVSTPDGGTMEVQRVQTFTLNFTAPKAFEAVRLSPLVINWTLSLAPNVPKALVAQVTSELTAIAKSESATLIQQAASRVAKITNPQGPIRCTTDTQRITITSPLDNKALDAVMAILPLTPRPLNVLGKGTISFNVTAPKPSSTFVHWYR